MSQLNYIAYMKETAIFAAGCFWGVEDAFRKIPGVIDVRSGYTGGTVPNPTYEQVCTNATGHAESVRVTYDPDKVSYEQLLDAFWKMHDPTQMNRQGPDVGSQYRSAIFYTSPQQKAAAEASKAALPNADKVVTEITEAGPFYEAEEYHQRYAEKNGGTACHV